MDKYVEIGKIGEGRCGVVYHGVNKLTGDMVAVKKIRKECKRECIPESARREISILRKLNHPNIVKLERVVLEKGRLYLIFEWLAADLKMYMEHGPTKVLDPSRVKCYLYQINSAILYCHQRGIVHRDLKPANLLVHSDSIIKLADFGTVRAVGAPVKACAQEVVPLWYRAPEISLGSKKYCCSEDMWSMGCIFAEMARGKPLFRGDCQIDHLFRIFRVLGTPTEKIWKGVTALPNFKSSFPNWTRLDLKGRVKNLDEHGESLLRCMLRYDPQRRATAERLPLHPYFSDVQLPPGIPRVSGDH